MEILVIRHGESEDETIDLNEPLTTLGIEQSKKMSLRVSQEFPPEIIWSSPLQRARETAQILATTVDCPIHYVDDLREQDQEESGLHFHQRVRQIFSHIKDSSKPFKRIAIVSHGGTITKLIQTFLQLPPESNAWFHTNNTGIHFLDYHSKADIIKFANSTDHLKPFKTAPVWSFHSGNPSD
ncbi:phosphoglycerate mutase family protein [Paenibacillus aurantius]|uniref:Phosphoglycerate mutase family protein n=1 Tax=Paenibacillus aurantius TaxID=2918900 RepID=A0AA96LCX5_9BACL|nr:phosphoglycerate mutase family protein [Paenibacillus aurantius]WNQ09890.1 phosphoglycerate mutase family protein [Paenibacillus aurantius]